MRYLPEDIERNAYINKLNAQSTHYAHHSLVRTVEHCPLHPAPVLTFKNRASYV